jgi:hypothetical protein
MCLRKMFRMCGKEKRVFLCKKVKGVEIHVRFEFFTAVTMKNFVFWDVTPRDSCKNERSI